MSPLCGMGLEWHPFAPFLPRHPFYKKSENDTLFSFAPFISHRFYLAPFLFLPLVFTPLFNLHEYNSVMYAHFHRTFNLHDYNLYAHFPVLLSLQVWMDKLITIFIQNVNSGTWIPRNWYMNWWNSFVNKQWRRKNHANVE